MRVKDVFSSLSNPLYFFFWKEDLRTRREKEQEGGNTDIFVMGNEIHRKGLLLLLLSGGLHIRFVDYFSPHLAIHF